MATKPPTSSYPFCCWVVIRWQKNHSDPFILKGPMKKLRIEQFEHENSLNIGLQPRAKRHNPIPSIKHTRRIVPMFKCPAQPLATHFLRLYWGERIGHIMFFIRFHPDYCWWWLLICGKKGRQENPPHISNVHMFPGQTSNHSAFSHNFSGTGIGKCPNWTSPNYLEYNLQQIFEGDVQNPQ